MKYANPQSILFFPLIIFSINTLVDPTGKLFGINMVLTICIFVLALIVFKFNISIKHLAAILFCSLFPASFSLLRSIAFANTINLDVDFALSTVNMYMQFTLFLFPLTLLDKSRLLNIFLASCVALVVIYVLAWVSLIVPDAPFIAGLSSYLEDADHTVMFANDGLFFSFTMFYKTCPVLLLFYGYLIFQKEYKWVPLTALTGILLVTSGTQANQLSVVLITMFKATSYAFSNYQNKTIFLIYILLGVAFVTLTSPILFDSSDAGNSIKFRDLTSYLDTWDNNWIDFFCGMGLGVSFYSLGRSRNVFLTELSWLEYLRRHGFFLAIIFFGFIFFPLVSLLRFKESQGIFIGYLSYLFVSGTNPLLTSSTGFFVIAFAWTYANRINLEHRLRSLEQM